MIQIDNFTFHNADNMEIMAQYPDKYFDLAIVDPPYGIGESKKKRENTKSDKWNNPTKKIHNVKDWDLRTPDIEYFEQLKRISKNQIIWGGNYFIDKIQSPSMGWIFWDKKNGDSDFSDGELAYTSFNKGLRKFEWLWNGFQKQKPEERFHPTQKPVDLYSWILQNYSKQGFKIIDTHLGSASIAIAIDKANKFDNMNLEFVGIELDKDYFEASMKRFNNYRQQKTIFE
ncbi:DNA methylase N-4/N-6 [uncultured Caudovirales phage]|uniref:DNA methylase N-4/N-6 n=1 Tax=uncultured Caudovirales phage TaxID=2100421 RepID=A0A6J7X5T2_9CAUD|nr:DNA methylase N-4/N-6 [uncultured Caudovirales phage]